MVLILANNAPSFQISSVVEEKARMAAKRMVDRAHVRLGIPLSATAETVTSKKPKLRVVKS